MVQQLKALAVLAAELSLVPSTHFRELTRPETPLQALEFTASSMECKNVCAHTCKTSKPLQSHCPDVTIVTLISTQ